MLGESSSLEVVACSLSADVMARLMAGEVDAAVLPIENSLHGSVAEHYDLLLELDVRIERESLDFHRAVDSAYRELAAMFPNRIVAVDGSRAAAEIAKEIRGRLRELS